MNTMLTGWDDTIVALATPPGVGAIGVIRVSGKETFRIVDALFPSKNLSTQPTHTMHVGMLRAGHETIDEVVVSLFRSPRSYTGEDVIEISCHGSPYIQQRAIEAITNNGARAARPGEFTQRAFLNGKLDLAQAEAVADVIASGTKASKDTALNAMRGGFSSVLSGLREQMIKFSALIELELDFSQEDVEFADRTQFYALVKEAATVTSKLLESFKYGNVIRNGVRVAIVGKPNAGKSTLLNALLNENRAIVSDIAGTTRDTIEEVLNIDGILFRLIDTAGIREHTTDTIERAGMEKTFEKIREADIIIYLFDASAEAFDGVKQSVSSYDANKILLVGNKIDNIVSADYRTGDGKQKTPELTQPRPKIFAHEGDRVKFITARENEGLDAVREAMLQLVTAGKVAVDDTIITNARHFEALQKLQSALTDIHTGLDTGTPSDLIALDIRRSLQYLGEITGEITNEEQLTWIFGKFCIGK